MKSRRWISKIFVDIYCVSDGRKEKTWFSKNALFAESAGENTKSVTQQLPGRIGARLKPHLLHFKFSIGFHICCRKTTKQAVSFLYFEQIGHCYASYYRSQNRCNKIHTCFLDALASLEVGPVTSWFIVSVSVTDLTHSWLKIVDKHFNFVNNIECSEG